jgi:hypothetical protein
MTDFPAARGFSDVVTCSPEAVAFDVRAIDRKVEYPSVGIHIFGSEPFLPTMVGIVVILSWMDMSFAGGIDPQFPSINQPRVMMTDLNGDGDERRYLPSTVGACFIERSFFEGGYSQATLIKVDRSPESE